MSTISFGFFVLSTSATFSIKRKVGTPAQSFLLQELYHDLAASEEQLKMIEFSNLPVPPTLLAQIEEIKKAIHAREQTPEFIISDSFINAMEFLEDGDPSTLKPMSEVNIECNGRMKHDKKLQELHKVRKKEEETRKEQEEKERKSGRWRDVRRFLREYRHGRIDEATELLMELEAEFGDMREVRNIIDAGAAPGGQGLEDDLIERILAQVNAHRLHRRDHF